MNSVEVLLRELQKSAAAREPPLEVEKQPEALTHSTLPLQEQSDRPTQSGADELKAVRIDCQYVLIGSLGESPSEKNVYDALRACHHRAAKARMWLASAQKDDLLLLLVGPNGSEGVLSWEAHASRVERDDRICRKLVWLPPAQEDDVESSACEFLMRTFLAQPWGINAGVKPQELDARRRLETALTNKNLAQPQDLLILEAWWPLLAKFTDGDEDFEDASEVIERLTEAFPFEGPRT